MRTPHNESLSGTQAGGAPERTRVSGRRRTSGEDGQNDGPANGPERRCILSGEHDARDGLIRLAVSPPGPDGVCMVLPDVLARAPGRGAWIGVSRVDLEAAMGTGKQGGRLKGALARSFKGAQLTIPDDLPHRIESALIRAFTDRLGLETRSGKLLTGSDRIAENARSGKVTWLAHAGDASVDGNRKLDQAWRVGSDEEGSGKMGITLPLDRAALSVALGRDNVVHLALTDRGAADRLNAILQRLLHFMGPAATDYQAATGQDETSDSALGDMPVAGITN